MIFRPTLSPHLTAAWLGALCFFLSPLHHAAQAQTQSGVQAQLMSERMAKGEQTALVIRVINGKPETLPDTIPVDGLEISRSERVEQKHSFGTGGSHSEYHFYYFVTGNQAGDFTIPSVSVRIDGKDYATEALVLTVFERDPGDPALDASRPYFASLGTPSPTLYAGQKAPFDLSIFVRGARSINDMGPPMLRHESIVIDFDRTYRLDGIELDGITFSTAKRPGSFFGLTPGTYTLGPAEVQVAMIDDSSPFGRMPGFFQSFVAKTLRSNPLEVTIKPLPEVGRPPGFRGAIGKFAIAVKASTSSINVGDPISLDFEVTGPGNYETLPAPTFLATDPSAWRTYDARKIVDPAEVSDGISSGKATFTQIVMPQAEVTEIPAFELAFFNPETGAYETQRTQPIPITVAPDTRVASGAAAGIAIPGAGAEAPTPGSYQAESTPTPQAVFNDIVHIRTTDPTWRAMPATITSRPLFWAGQILPSLAFFTILGIGVARRIRLKKSEQSSVKAISFKTAMAAVSAATNRGDFYRAILTALASWQREVGASGQENLPDDLKAALEALRSRSQRILYGATDDDQARPPEAQESEESGNILAVIKTYVN